MSDGNAVLRCNAVGDSTEIGKIGKMVVKEDEEETPLNYQLKRLSDWIGVIAFIVAALLVIALVARGVINGEISLTAGQWIFAGISGVSVLAALVPIWLPIFYTGLSLTGRKDEPPAWLEEEGIMIWIRAVVIGALLFGVFTGSAFAVKLLPGDPSQWFPAATAKEFLKYFMLAVTIIVVAVPEGLPMSVTLSLAYSMRRMIATNNLVRRMHACETIGSATVICSDKTGTLTRNEMHLQDMDFPSIEGNRFLKDSAAPTLQDSLIIEAFAANSTANLGTQDGKAVCPLGNPTECALLMWLNSNKVNYMDARSSFKLWRQLPFDTRRKFMASAGKS
ncbi:HAD-IC family P-type ATPase, partial [Dolichospermum sp. ST_sed3]|nr:HAD-IC family P-type ATPase [Dolichospermum sp. ST_sed3]